MYQDPSTYSSNMNTLPQFPENEHLNCPRCDSSNTKFCYYNNYNLSQPRHFCKNCRRYWTKGGTLRKIPIGGGTRKITKRSSPVKTPPLLPPSPPAQMKPELSPVFDFGNDQGKVRSKPNLSDGSENGAPVTGVLLRNYLIVNNDDDDRIRSDGGGRGESSGCDGSTSSKRSNSNDSQSPTSPVTNSPVLPLSPPAQLKLELSPVFDFGNDQGKVRSNHLEQFGGFVDVLKPNLSDGSENGAPVLLRNYLSVNNDEDKIRNGGGGGGGGCDGGGNEWTNLSIFTSGSNFN